MAGLLPMVGDTEPPEIPNHPMVSFQVTITDGTSARCVGLGGRCSIATPKLLL